MFLKFLGKHLRQSNIFKGGNFKLKLHKSYIPSETSYQDISKIFWSAHSRKKPKTSNDKHTLY